MAEVQGTLEFADTDVLMEYHDWSLLDHSPKMGPDEFAIRETARSFEIDLDGRHVTYQFASETEQLVPDTHVEGWTPEGLVLWLDRQVRQMDIPQVELLKWLREMVDHLLRARGMTLAALMRCKFLLAGKIDNKIKAIRQREREGVYQQYLFAPKLAWRFRSIMLSPLRTACTGTSGGTEGAGNRNKHFSRPGQRARFRRR